jgi:RimK family alpha-L-glutamate ligase
MKHMMAPLFEKVKPKGVVYTFGRFNPPHVGHEKVIDRVVELANRHGYDHRVYSSTSHDKSKNPLAYEKKMSILKDSFKNANIVEDPDINNAYSAARSLSDEGVKHVIFVSGSDRIDEYNRGMQKYVDHPDRSKSWGFRSFRIVGVGDRHEDSSGVDGASSTKMRQYAADGDIDQFKANMPKSIKDRASEIMNDVQSAMQIKEEISDFFDSISIDDLNEDKFKFLSSTVLSEDAQTVLKAMDFESDEEQETPTVVIITSLEDGEFGETATKIHKEAEKLGVLSHLVSADHAYVAIEDITEDSITLSNADGKGKSVVMTIKDTVCISRGSATSSDAGLALIRAIEHSGIFCVNSSDTSISCNNKLNTHANLRNYKVPSPRSSSIQNIETLDEIHKKIGGKFPVVIKTLTGAEGIGVSKADSFGSLKSVLQSLFKYEAELLLQEYIEHDHDIRSIVLDGKVIASMKRIKKDPEADFRSNRTMGNDTEPYSLSQEEKALVLQAARSVDGYMVGVDHIIDKDKKYVLEVNASPGSGADKYTIYEDDSEKEGSGSDVLKIFVKHIIDRSNWVHDTVEVGVREVLDVHGYGLTKSKLDTGNSSFSSLHADEIEIGDEEVTFKTPEGKTLTKTLIGIAHTDIGDGTIDERPVVQFDITINGRVYKDEYFALNDRSDMQTQALISKYLIQRSRLSINPARKNVLSD